MSSNSGQKFIRRNRAPRVQIEYEVELYGAQKKIELPFVMGVMADLHGTPAEPPAKVEDRKFLEVDHDNFDARLKALKPRVATRVKNTLSGEGTMAIDLTFESMDDFAPGALARKIEPLRKLLEARSRLSDLVTYMDGRGEAEALLSEKLRNPEELRRLVQTLGEARAKADVEAADEGETP
ncbi:MAG: type VI secretion system contractile sheath small subunit [Polyangiales bacterium]